MLLDSTAMTKREKDLRDEQLQYGLDDVETAEDVARALERVENKLAQKLGIRRLVRRELVAIVRRGALHDELLEEWIELYSTYMHWMRAEARSALCEEDPPQEFPVSETTERAAQAARLLL